MLYIHKLSDLQMKSADVESVYLIRDIKQKIGFPIQAGKFEEYFSEFFVSETDLQLMEDSLVLLASTKEKVQALLAQQSDIFEHINLTRAIQILDMLPEGLHANILFCKEMKEWQEQFIMDASSFLNLVPKLRSKEERVMVNGKISSLFEKLLRNDQFSFHFWDIINESHTANLQGLLEGIQKGYLFHFTIEEELKKLDLNGIRNRLPTETIAMVEEIDGNLQQIDKGVKRAYDANMRMVNAALVLFSCVKWVNNGV